MATVRVYSAERMKQIEDETIVSGSVDESSNLILTTRAGTTVNAGNVKGEQGIQGVPGEVTAAQLEAVETIANTANGTATSALSTANTAISIAQASKVISRGRTLTGVAGGTLKCEWVRMTNGVQFVWGRCTMNPTPAFVQLGSCYTMTQAVYILQAFGDGVELPTITIGEAAQSGFGATWGQAEQVSRNLFTLRVWAPNPRVSSNLLFSYFGAGYYKTPTD